MGGEKDQKEEDKENKGDKENKENKENKDDDEEEEDDEEEGYEWDDVKLPSATLLAPSGWQTAVVNVPTEGQFLGFREVANPGVFTDFQGALRRMQRHPDEDKKAQLVAFMESAELKEY